MRTRSQARETSRGASNSWKVWPHKTIQTAKRVKMLSASLLSPKGVKAEKPPTFSWVVEGLLAAHGRPARPSHVRYLCNQNIQMLITLTENIPRALQQYPGSLRHIPVKDEKPPSVEQACEFVTIVNEAQRLGQRVSVHCAWGRGRTGTLLACYLGRTERLSATAAIARVRHLRPGSVDNAGQEQTVKEYLATPDT